MRAKPLRVAILCSHRAPALGYLLERDSHRGTLYEIVACHSSEATFAQEDLVRESGVPVTTDPLRAFCAARACALGNPAARTAYDEATLRRLMPYAPDLVVLDAYLYVLSEPMLAAFRGRILNIHHSDLLVCTEDGRPRFPGLRAVREAILAGMTETRATVHLVTAGVDEGPPLVRSWPFPVAPLVARALTWGAMDILKAYAYAHQEWMIRETWGPLAAATLTLITEGRLDLDGIYDALGNRRPRPFTLYREGRIHRSAVVPVPAAAPAVFAA